jgi:hypothetical protein
MTFFPQLGSRMLLAIVLAGFAVSPALATPSDDAQSKKPEKMTEEMRMNVVRALSAEFVYARTAFPMGPKGLRIKDGKISPSETELRQMLAQHGPAVRLGDRAMITAVTIKDRSIFFEINGGPKKKKKWYERIEVSGVGGTRSAPSKVDENTNPRGSVVELAFDKYVPQIGPDEIKKLLDPVFNFKALSAAEAYLENIPPKAREAIKNHQVLVGMDREMVGYAKGRPPKRHRERDGGVDYEEWIYGEPPKEVEFVRFVGDEVVRVEIMSVDGAKVIRTAKEIELPKMDKAAVAEAEAPPPKPASAPTLRRPGEEPPAGDQAPVSNRRAPMPPREHAPEDAPNPAPPIGTPR